MGATATDRAPGGRVSLQTSGGAKTGRGSGSGGGEGSSLRWTDWPWYLHECGSHCSGYTRNYAREKSLDVLYSEIYVVLFKGTCKYINHTIYIYRYRFSSVWAYHNVPVI